MLCSHVQLLNHLLTCSKKKRPCRYNQFGCSFLVGTFLLLSCNIHSSGQIILPTHVIPKGDLEELNSHNNEAALQHLELVCHEIFSKTNLESSERVLAITALYMRKQKQATDMQIMAFHNELSRLREEAKAQIRRLESFLVDLQNGTTKLNLMAKTFLVTSYNGEFIWKIPGVAQKTRKARVEEGICLLSHPFFTNPFGYKLCLCLNLNGHGAGKGTHLSFSFIITQGLYDNLLKWPFEQMVALMLLNQDKRKNIVGLLHPEPSHPSFQQPKTEMNLPAGFSKFAPLSVLSNPSYVRNDTLYLKVIVDTTGLDQP